MERKGWKMDLTYERVIGLISEKYPSDAAFEREIGIPQRTVADWKRRKSKSYLKMIPQLCEALNVTTDYLLGRVDEHDGNLPAFPKTKERSGEEMVTVKLPPLGTLYCSIPGESVQQWELVGFQLDKGKARLRAIGLLAEVLKRDLSRAFPNASIDEMCTITVDLAWLNGREVDSSRLVNSA